MRVGSPHQAGRERPGSRVSHGLSCLVIRRTNTREVIPRGGFGSSLVKQRTRERRRRGTAIAAIGQTICDMAERPPTAANKTPHRRRAQAGRCSSLIPIGRRTLSEYALPMRRLFSCVDCLARTWSHSASADPQPIPWARTRPQRAGVCRRVGSACEDRDGEPSWNRGHRVKLSVPIGDRAETQNRAADIRPSSNTRVGLRNGAGLATTATTREHRDATP